MAIRLFREELKRHNFSNELICEDHKGAIIVTRRSEIVNFQTLIMSVHFAHVHSYSCVQDCSEKS